MRVLVACECSGRVRRAFRGRGHDAWSNDLEPSWDWSPYHLQMDCRVAIADHGPWDLIILHPDCTAMALSGNRWYGKGMPMHHKRHESVQWTVDTWELAKASAPRVALENPASVVFQHLGAPVQYIQPYQFGHGETKRTGLALHNLPELVPTDEVVGREQRIWKMAPSDDRKARRSETFLGVADAMADQWGGTVLEYIGDYSPTRLEKVYPRSRG